MKGQGQHTSARMRFSFEDVERMIFDSATGEDLSRSSVENPSTALLGMIKTDFSGLGVSTSFLGTLTISPGGSPAG